MLDHNEMSEIILHGINASPGICIGKAYLVDREGVKVVEKYSVAKKNLTAEKNRFKSAVKKAMDELKSIISNTPEELKDQATILEIHMVLLKDKMLYGKTLDTIEKEQINAEWALKKVSSTAKTMFRQMEDSYFKERSLDIGQVSDRIMRNLVGAEEMSIADIDKRVILVARDLSPADTSQIQLEKIKGFITDAGGRTSHTSIIARTLDIPAVLGLKNATKTIKNDDLIVVNGTTGTVILHPTEKTLMESENRQYRYAQHRAIITRSSHRPAKTLDGLRVKVMGNIELPEEVVSVIDHGGDGIGLYRTEFQYMSRPDFPSEFELFDKYKDVVEVMAPHPVTIRTLDINGDKTLILNASDEIEVNPALGLRAIRYCLKNPEIFKTQLKAILRAAAFGNVRILFPMISSHEEIVEAKKLLAEAADCLEREGQTFNRDIEIGIMIEVPSAVLLADIMAKEVDFFSIGTNDLIQYTLAVDRGNREVAHMFQPLHPAIIRMVRRVSTVANDQGIKIFMCGEMAADPLHIPVLLALGIDELSMSPQSIPAVKSMIRLINNAELATFLDNVMTLSTTAAVAGLVEETFGAMISDKIYGDLQ
jgi:phosphoenolpyruvate-protein phosphotransferase (PTS system enzyme I)